MFDGVSVAGYTLYYNNGTLAAFDLHGQKLQEGTFEVQDGPDFCYERETYPQAFEPDTC